MQAEPERKQQYASEAATLESMTTTMKLHAHDEEHQQLAHRAAEALTNHASHVRNFAGSLLEEFRERSHELLPIYSKGTLRRIEVTSTIKGSPASKLFSGMNEHDWSDTNVNDFLAFTENEENLFTLIALSDITPYIKGLSYYPLHPLTSYDAYPVQRREQMSALINVAYEMIQSGEGYNLSAKNKDGETIHVIPDQKMIDLLLYSGYDPEYIARYIKEHQTFNVGRIKEILEFEVPAIRDGVL